MEFGSREQQLEILRETFKEGAEYKRGIVFGEEMSALDTIKATLEIMGYEIVSIVDEYRYGTVITIADGHYGYEYCISFEAINGKFENSYICMDVEINE